MPLLRAVRVPLIGDGLWARRLLALAVAAAVAAPVAAGLLRLPIDGSLDASCLLWVVTGARICWRGGGGHGATAAWCGGCGWRAGTGWSPVWWHDVLSRAGSTW
ncbi:hypothetical protein ABZ807_04870 [Micromonospora sp. NPDC047548]|uniref:hypothetical protein n=1 Tax=Micromonospora sp. NPDC047548 TaxID=3155624 RepID=UPI0033F3BFE9